MRPWASPPPLPHLDPQKPMQMWRSTFSRMPLSCALFCWVPWQVHMKVCQNALFCLHSCGEHRSGEHTNKAKQVEVNRHTLGGAKHSLYVPILHTTANWCRKCRNASSKWLVGKGALTGDLCQSKMLRV